MPSDTIPFDAMSVSNLSLMSSDDSVTSPTDDLARYTRLIIVCGHATYLGDGTRTSEDQWLLQDFQKSNREWNKRSEHETFLAHLLLAAQAAEADPRALLILSGGQTTPARRSEAEGYGALLLPMVQRNPALFPRPLRFALETHATDSYQNLLFSLLRFRQLTGAYPQDVTVVTHAFKERRFLEQHGPALKWPAHALRVAGLNPPFTAAEREQVERGERDRAVALFAEDPYGVRAPLSVKRKARNWDAARANVFLGYGLEKEVAELLEWTGGVSGWETYPGRLPWQK